MWKSSYAQVQIFAKWAEKDKFQQIVRVNYKLEEFVYLLDAIDSVHDKGITNQPIGSILQKLISSNYSSSILILVESGWGCSFELAETYFSSWKYVWVFIKLYLQLQKLLPEKLH